MQLNLKPSYAKVREYFSALNQFGQLNISHETAVRQAFASLLDTCAKQFKWKLVQEFRIPAPKRLSELHVDYEKRNEYPLERKEKPDEKLDFRVEKMRLSKDKQTLVYNDFLTLSGIPQRRTSTAWATVQPWNG